MDMDMDMKGNMKSFVLILGLVIGFGVSAFSQDVAAIEDSLSRYYKILAASKNDALSDSTSQKMRNLFIQSFSFPETFIYPFEKLNMSRITSSDGRVRLFNWNQPKQDGTYKYYCFVLNRDIKTGAYEWFELVDNQKEVDKIENKILNADKWMGALYYEIIPLSTDKKNNSYVVLGWDGKDDLTTRKMVDILEFSGSKVRLGAAIFKTELGSQKRLIYEYSNDISMSIKFYQKKKCIVMDHLAPKNPMMTGVYADYGPDGTYDLYQLEKGKFELHEKIDISEFAEDDERPYVDPRTRRRRR